MFFLPMLPIFFVPLLSGFSSGGSFPKPLAKEKEQQLLLRLRDGTDAEKESAKQTLILHNLRLVAHIAKKYNNAQRESEELISIGIVGLIKAILSYDSEKSIRLATYASRCIENEILMYLRKISTRRNEVSFDEPLNTDWDGNELLLSDVLGTEGDMVMKPIEEVVDRALLFEAVSRLSEREQTIITLRFGLNGKQERTQKEVADLLGISQSYISRLEKRIISRLKKEILRML